MVKITFIEPSGVKQTLETEEGMTVMETAVRNSVPGIVAECGGACACATCHVYVDETFFPLTGKPTEKEEDMLDFAYQVKPNSRLSCQIKISPALEGIILTIPDRQG